MDHEGKAIDAVATECRLIAVSVSARSIQRVACDLVSGLHMNPNERRIHISDMFGRIIEVTRIDIEVQNADTIATMAGNKRIIVQTCVVNKARLVRLGQTPTHGVAFADGLMDGVINLLPNIDMYVIDTVVTLCGLSAILIVACLRDVIQFAPGERCFAIADIECIFVNMIGLMDEEMQAVNAVATE